MNETTDFVSLIVNFASGKMIPFMFIAFGIGIIFRFLLYYTIKREDWFSKEFEKRVEQHDPESSIEEEQSFFYLTRKILEKTYYETFELRSFLKRRKPDLIMTLTDRLFLIQQGTARFISDVTRRIRIVKYNSEKPDFEGVTKNTLERNACFSRVLGIFPTTLVNDSLSILPGIFIVLGILGTFLGIMKALPEIGNIDFSNPESSKMIMDQFLIKISFSMRTSIIGIVFSVCLTVLNSIFSVEKIYMKTVERFVSSFDLLWNYASSNSIFSRQTEDEINAAKSLEKELGRKKVEEEKVIEIKDAA